MEDRIVEIDRINTLNKGDKFLFNGGWRVVRKIENGRLYYVALDKKLKMKPQDLSAESKQFVEIERKQDIKPTKYEEDNLCTTTDHLR